MKMRSLAALILCFATAAIATDLGSDGLGNPGIQPRIKSGGLGDPGLANRELAQVDPILIEAGEPSLDFRFADNKWMRDSVTNEQSLITFSRASSGTYVASDGLLKRALVNQALYSEQFDNAAWLKPGATALANQAVSPDGKQTADLVYPALTAAELDQKFAVTAGTTYTQSWYVKYNGWQFIQLVDTSAFFGGIYKNFDVQNGLITGGDNTSMGAVENVGDGWFRVSITATAIGTGSSARPGAIRFINASNSSRGATCTPSGTSGIYVWGAQLVEGSSPGPYIRTTSAVGGAPRFDHDPVTGESLGLLVEEARTNLLKYSRDLTQADWVDTDVTVALDQTGADGVTSSASSLTATAGNGTVSQAVTSASAARATSAYVKRITGTGTIEMTQDGGSTWTAVTVTAAWTKVTIPSATVTDPEVGFRIVTSGDAIAVDFVQLETGAFSTSAIPTTTSTATRAADVAAVQDADFSTTNLLSYSESFDVGWTTTQATVTANSTVAPDGQTTADTFLDVSAGTYAEIKQTPSFTSGVQYSFSIRAKQGTRRYVRMALTASRFPSGSDAVFDLQDGVIKSQGAGIRSATIRPAGNGFYECTIMATATSTGTGDFYIYHMNDLGTSILYTGTGTGSIYLWGASLTATEYPVAYTTTRNLVEDSQDLERSTWSASSTTVGNDVAQAPDGTLTADDVTSTGANGTLRNATTTLAVSYTFSVWLKRKTGTGDVDISVDGTTWDTKTLTSDWQRFTVTQTGVAGTSNPGVRLVTSGDAVYMWGAQLEPGTVATDYVRTVDTVGKAYRWYEPTEGTVVVDGRSPLLASWTNPRFANFNDGGNNNVIETYLTQNSTVSVSAGFRVFDGGVIQVLSTRTGTNAEQFRKFSSAYKLNNFGVTTEGNAVATDTSGTVPDGIIDLEIGAIGGTNITNGHIRRLTYWPTRQPDATLQVITQ